MWDLIVSVPDHCLSFYFPQASSVLSASPVSFALLFPFPFPLPLPLPFRPFPFPLEAGGRLFFFGWGSSEGADRLFNVLGILIKRRFFRRRHPRDLQVSVATRFCRVLIFASSQYLSVIYLCPVMIN